MKTISQETMDRAKAYADRSFNGDIEKTYRSAINADHLSADDRAIMEYYEFTNPVTKKVEVQEVIEDIIF